MVGKNCWLPFNAIQNEYRTEAHTKWTMPTCRGCLKIGGPKIDDRFPLVSLNTNPHKKRGGGGALSKSDTPEEQVPFKKRTGPVAGPKTSHRVRGAPGIEGRPPRWVWRSSAAGCTWSPAPEMEPTPLRGTKMVYPGPGKNHKRRQNRLFVVGMILY